MQIKLNPATTTIISLLIGALGLSLAMAVWLPGFSLSPQIDTISFTPQQLQLDIGSRTNSKNRNEISINREGKSAISVPIQAFQASDIAFIKVDFKQLPDDASTLLLWRPAGGEVSTTEIPNNGAGRAHVYLADKPSWQGEIIFLAVAVFDKPGSTWQLGQVSLSAESFWSQINFSIGSWQKAGYWTHNSANFYRGYETGALPLVPILVSWLLLSALTYRLLVLSPTTVQEHKTGGYGILILLVWLLADSFWQAKLTTRAVDSYNTFFALDQRDKRNIARDGPIAHFAEQIKDSMVAPKNRIFIASDSNFLGMTIAYHLYPENVYWDLSAHQFPSAEHFHSGDYLLAMKPSPVSYNPLTSSIHYRDNKKLSVTKILDKELGTLFRIQ